MIYSRKTGKGKGESAVSLAIEAYPLVEKSWRECCSALALQCVPALRLAFFFLPSNMEDTVLKSEEEGAKGWEKLKLNLHVV